MIQQVDQQVVRNKKLPYILAGAGLLALLPVFVFISLGKNNIIDTKQQAALTQRDTLKKTVVPVNNSQQTGVGTVQQQPVVPQLRDNTPLQIIEPLPQPEKKSPEKKEKPKKETEKSATIKKTAGRLLKNGITGKYNPCYQTGTIPPF